MKELPSLKRLMKLVSTTVPNAHPDSPSALRSCDMLSLPPGLGALVQPPPAIGEGSTVGASVLSFP